MGKYKRYERYKDSGVEWIGEVPVGWGKSKIAWCFNMIGSGCTPNSTSEEFYDGDINWLITGDLNDGIINSTSKKVTKLALKEYSTLKLYSKNSLVVAMYGATIGKLGITNIETATNQACCVLTKPRDTYIKYMFYWFLANRNEIVNLSQGGGQPNISQNLIKDLKIYKPSIKEQTQIANFLDQKTSEIDALITDKEKLITLLEEKRQAMITEAVTKGLDPNVKMKDSGVEWIGEVPEHWEIIKTKYISDKIGSGKTPLGGSEKYLEEGILFLRSQNIYDEGLKLDDVVYISEEINNEMYNSRVIPNDILINITGASIGRSCIFPSRLYQANVNQHVCIIRPKVLLVEPEYLSYVFKSNTIKEQINAYQNGSSREGLNFQQVGNLICPIPSVDEQKTIIRYIKREINGIGNIILQINSQIEKLKEYRQSLISEAVTGKIDLRDKVGRFDD